MKLPLIGKANSWESFSLRKRSKKFQAVRKKLLVRDDYKCHFCEFRSPKNEIINLDGDYSNNKPDNLAVACHVCMRCVLMDFYTIDYDGKDQMLLLPEMTQVQLNQLVRLLLCRMEGSSEAAYNAQMIYAQLQDRAILLDDAADTRLSHPGIFLQYLNSPGADRDLLSRVRWLPSQETFAEFVPHWSEMLEDVLL